MKKIVALLLSLVLAACLSVSALADTIELDFWTVFTGGDGDTIQSMVDQFNEEHPEIHVTHSPMLAADLYEKLPMAVQTGSELPDVCINHISHVHEMVDSGVLTDVSYLTENGVDLSNYPTWMVEANTYDDLPYSIPFDLHGVITYANLDLLEKYGMTSILDDKAITFDELFQLYDAVQASGDTDVYVTNYYESLYLYLRLYQEKAGKSWKDEDGNLAIDNEIFTQVVEDLRTLNEKPGMIKPKDESDKSLFLAGKEVLYSGGTWTKNTVVNAGINFVEVIPFGYTGETSLFSTSSHVFTQPVDDNRTEEEDAAVATFINWMGEHSYIWAQTAGQMAVHSSVINSDYAAELPQSFIVSEEYGDRAMLLDYYYISLLESALNRAGLDALYDTSIDATTVGAGIVQEVNDALAQK